MLIEFSLSNRRSFAEEQTLSLMASRLKDDHPNRIFRIPGPHNVEVLNSAIILGKNGSGKSTLVEALGFVRRFVRESSSSGQEGDPIDQQPNLLDSSLTGKDSSFRLLFSMVDKIYQFTFSLNKERVTHEALSIADRTARFRNLYQRVFKESSQKYSYTFSDDFRGLKSIWQRSTRANALFMSTAMQLNAEVLREPFQWLTEHLRAMDATSTYTAYTAGQCDSDENKSRVLNFLRRLDIDVKDILIEEEELDETFLKEMFNEAFIKRIASQQKSKPQKVRFVHTATNGQDVALDLSDESEGTKALFALAGPLFDTLSKGNCLVIDEVNTSLHPLILQTLVESFSDPDLNPKRAQLIFTSHDTSLLRDAYFRRDQIWFVDKDRAGRSSLVPLSDFSPRKGEALEKGYMTGRYGGVPSIDPNVMRIEPRELGMMDAE